MSVNYFGKYRGVVTNNVDPMQMGRVRVQVPGVFGAEDTWAMPCVPVNLPKKAGSALPEIGASVWIEFEQGDPTQPIWTGRFFRDFALTPPSLRNR
jgi:hypothetical protein